MNHRVILRHDEHKLLKGFEVCRIRRVLPALDLVVDVREEVRHVAERLQARGVAVVVRLRQVVLHERGVRSQTHQLVDGLADQAEAGDIHRALRHACNAHHDAVHGDEAPHRGIVVPVDVPTNDCVALGEADSIEAVGQARISANNTGELIHLIVHIHQKAVALVFHHAARKLRGAGAELNTVHIGGCYLRDHIPHSCHSHWIVRDVPHAMHHHDGRADLRSGRARPQLRRHLRGHPHLLQEVQAREVVHHRGQLVETRHGC
mmetsp:Transcript_106014/g.299917  ORF Transcript_106014/g.299917 Transcript_106014/m.299917 type:complete len:262 (+) Transcript_106014:328-1113(+)